LLDWKRINKLISKVEIRRTSVAGRDAYSAEVMFRIMLVQAWYKLSDYQMEEQLVYNTMFLWFCHLSMENPVPDHSTICRWRGRFSEKRIYEKLLQEINHQLSKHDIRITEGVIVDATLVESHARPRRKEFIETEPVGDDEIPGQTTFQATKLTVEESKDPEARWLKKGNKSIYGYKDRGPCRQGLLQPGKRGRPARKETSFRNHEEEKEESGYARGNQALQLLSIYSEIPD
jgi:IS5 family transposase